MTTLERRRLTQRIVTTPSGALLDEAALEAMLREWAARAPRRTRVERLSASDPALRETAR